MTTNTVATEKLAILGGEPISATGLSFLAWPPAREETGQKLLDVFFSRKWSFNGPQEQAFAREFADYHGAKHGIFMANGTVTLQCALQALGVGAGDEVIIPALTWPATAMAVLYCGAVPVFVDVDADSLCIDHTLIEAAITPKTKAIIPVHLYGGMADMEAILEIARRHNLSIVEDCAHAHGGKWNGRGVGSWGHVGSFSFQESKTMASGEGGICLTNDDDLAERLYRLKHIGYPPASAQGKAGTSPAPDLVCSNFRGTEFQAVILRDQLADLKELIETYNANAAIIEERLAGVPGVRVQARGRLSGPQSYYAFAIILDDEIVTVPHAKICEAIAAEGLSINNTYGPVYKHVLWNLTGDKFRLPEGGCTVADTIGSHNCLVLLHWVLGSEPEVIEKIGDILVKVLSNLHALAATPGEAQEAEAAGSTQE